MSSGVVRGSYLRWLVLIAALLPPGALRAETSEERLSALEARLSRLERNLELLLQKVSSASQVENQAAKELKEAAQPLTGELQQLQAANIPQVEPTAQAVQESTLVATSTSAPGVDAAAEIQNVPYAGYMETHLNHDGLNPTTFDFHRFVLLFGHGFGDRIRFWSELEFEHAFVEGREVSGEIALEQAYLDFLIHPKLNFRAGMLLSPVGIINERHEPPSFNGVERPFVDTFIVPSTWFGSGGGFVGDLGKGFAYKAYLMTSLDSTGFSADEGFRGGRQQGFFENAQHMAPVGRLEYRGVPGLDLG
ncbi:MAG TPA: hypothetical protein VFS12_12375, partial [Terriglobia bacterium]|nr:hypothetical protein [Terriglobia bacterium]